VKEVKEVKEIKERNHQEGWERRTDGKRDGEDIKEYGGV
jgi:hypothetical protein